MAEKTSSSGNKLIAKFDILKSETSALLKDAIINQKLDSFFDKVGPLFNDWNENDMKSMVELVTREILLHFLAQSKDMQLLDKVFQFSIDAALKNISPRNLPVLVLQDMFDGSTLSDCEKIFTLVESRVEIFKQEYFFAVCKNHLLRSCNDLQRRLSRSQNTVFCGRILCFLAQFFPLSERSGLNIISEFNLDNTTVFSSKEDAFTDTPMEIEEIDEDGETTACQFTTDFNLYRKFWTLQEYFRNPALCYNKMNWRHFTTYSTEILTVFASFKSDDSNSSKWKQTGTASNDGSFTYFAKYLTSPKLLELELSDSHFRRNVLVQFLIVFQYLTSPVKFKLDSYVLTEEQQNWVKDATEKVHKILTDTPPDGQLFSKNVEKMLKREEYWNAWKNDMCPEFKSIKNTPLPVHPSHKKKWSETFVQNPEIAKLCETNPEDNWTACRDSRRDFVPAMKNFFSKAVEQANAKKEDEHATLDTNDPKFGWKALRLLSMKSPHFFAAKDTTQFKNLPGYLEYMIQKIPIENATPDMSIDVETNGNNDEPLDDGNEETLTNCEDETEKVEKTIKVKTLSKSQITEVSNIMEIQNKWKDLAKYLDFKEDEIEYYAQTFQTVKEQTENMIAVWAEQDPLGGATSSFKCALQQAGLVNHAISILQ